VAIDAAFAMGLAGLWLDDRGAWLPWAANAAYHWTASCLLGGVLVDARPRAHSREALAPLCAATAIGGAAWLLRRGAKRRPA
jgi:hypothetical protein